MSFWSKERIPIIDVDGQKEEPFPEQKEKLPEGKGFIEKVEKEAELKTPVVHQGQILVTSPQAAKLQIVLPITAKAFANPENWRKSVTFAVRWLLTLVSRLRKKYPGETVFRS